MELIEGGKYYKELSKYSSFFDCKHYIEQNEINEAYNIANKKGSQMTSTLTMYLLKEALPAFHIDPLSNLDCVPKNYLYEAKDENLCVYVNQGIKEIQENAFAYATINKLIISKNVEKIGENALSLNKGQIEYEGKKDEFIGKFLGRTNCFKKSSNQQIICQDGTIEIFS